MENIGFLYFLFLLFLLFLSAFAEGGSIGINYGHIANDLPAPLEVVKLLKAQGLNRVKLYDTDSEMLTALANSGISVTVALPNELLSSTAADQSFADKWVQSNISLYHPATRIEAIAVGNEVFADPNNTTNFLVPAMKNIHASLVKYNLDSVVKISSPVALSALQSSYPSSAGAFKAELVEPFIKPMLELVRQTKSYLMVNVRPFFAYSATGDKFSLNFALFKQNPGVIDSGNGLRYNSLFEAQLDAVLAALSALKYDDVKVVVTETGWPSLGDPHEIGAGQVNAAEYNGNLVRRVLTGGGTPLRPQDPLNVFLFALFNENLKPCPISERNYGLFYPNQKKVYDIPLTKAELGRGQSTPVSGSKSQQAPAKPDTSKMSAGSCDYGDAANRVTHPSDSSVVCNFSELLSCVGAMNSSPAPTKTCCQRLKAQGQSCLCSYLRDQKYRKYLKSPGATRFASACQVVIPNC